MHPSAATGTARGDVHSPGLLGRPGVTHGRADDGLERHSWWRHSATDSRRQALGTGSVDDGRNVGRWRRSKSRPRGRGYCAVLSARAEGRVSIPVSLT